MNPLRWGVLGVAKINDRLLPAFAAAENARLVAIASRDAGRAKAAAAAAGIPKAYGHYDQLLADPDVEAVYVPLPNTLHAPWTKRAADAGKHVLCEKPLAATAVEAAELAAYCKAAGVRLMDGFMWPHHARTARLRQVIDAGDIGKVRHVAGAFTFTLPLDAPNIRLRADTAGGSLLDVGCYPVYGIRWAFRAEPVRVNARATMLHGVDAAMNAIMHFEGGRVATFDCGFILPLRQWLEIAGTKGVIRVPEMWLPGANAVIEVTCGNGPTEVLALDGRDQIVCMLEGFGKAVREGREPEPSPDEAVKTLRVLD
ncbi:MAG TPA: Gfo/Idh/MocA family oxidoreductase, partial [Gemmataceae bacterium]